MKRAIYLILTMLVLITVLATGCSLDFLNDDDSDEDDTTSDYSSWDESSDILNWHDGDSGDIEWYETYDYDENDNCILVKRFSSNDTFYYADAYAWEEISGGYVPVSSAHFNDEKVLQYYSHYFYNVEGKITTRADYEVEYDAQDVRTDTLIGKRVWDYTAEDKVERTDSYDGSDQLEWAYQFEYEAGTNLVTLSSAYGADGARTAYIEYDYSGDDDSLLRRTGYGDCTSSTSHNGTFSGISLHATSGNNTEDRTEPGLVTPDYPDTEPSVAAAVLADDDHDYKWMELWNVFSDYGVVVNSYVLLNDEYLPVIIKSTTENVTGIEGPIEVRIVYNDDDFVESKTTWYDGHEALNLDFEYEDGKLTKLSTSGEATIPLTFTVTYNEDNLPYMLAVSSGDVPLYSFEYEYSGDNFDPQNPLEFAQGIIMITQRDGSGAKMADYEFAYNDDTVRKIVITVTDYEDDPDGEENGKFEIYYNDDDMIGGIAAFNTDGEEEWKYEYTYEEFESQMNRLTEIKLDEEDIPEVVFTFDIESLLGDITAFVPGL